MNWLTVILSEEEGGITSAGRGREGAILRSSSGDGKIGGGSKGEDRDGS